MTVEDWQKIATYLLPAIIGAGTVYISLRQFFLGNKNSYREEYKFAKSFLEDIDNNPKLHKFARHKGYQAMLGSQSIPSEVIEYLIKSENPVRSLDDYVTSRSYLKHTSDSGTIKLSFESGFFFSTVMRRKIWLILYFLGFVTCYLFACSPLIGIFFNQLTLTIALSLGVFTLPVGMIGTVFFVREFVQLRNAIRLLFRLDEESTLVNDVQNSEEHY